MSEEEIERLKNMYGPQFTQLLDQYKYPREIWNHCLDPNVMLGMLRLSRYRQSYYEELCEFARWQFKELRKLKTDVRDFDEFRAGNEASQPCYIRIFNSG